MTFCKDFAVQIHQRSFLRAVTFTCDRPSYGLALCQVCDRCPFDHVFFSPLYSVAVFCKHLLYLTTNYLYILCWEGKLHTCPERANYTYVERGQTTHMSREGKLHICRERANYTHVQRGQTTNMSREGKRTVESPLSDDGYEKRQCGSAEDNSF